MLQKKHRTLLSTAILFLAFLVSITTMPFRNSNGRVFADGIPSDDLTVVTRNSFFWSSGRVAPLPLFSFTMTLNGTTATLGATVNGSFSSDYTITSGQVNVGVFYRGTSVGGGTGNFTAPGPVTLNFTTFTVPAGATMDDLDFSYGANYTLQFTTVPITRSFSFSDTYSSGRLIDGATFSGSEHWDMRYERPCPSVGSFTATPATVPAGSPVTLQWNVSNRFRNRVRIVNTATGAIIGEFANGSDSTTFTPTATTNLQLQLVDASGNPVGCFANANVTVQVNSGLNFFWLVKRKEVIGEQYPPGSPPFYIEPPIGVAPPGSNNPDSFRRVPETGFFQATSFSEAQTMLIPERDLARNQMLASDQFLPGGFQSDNFKTAQNDFRFARHQLYPNALNKFNSQTPGYSGPKQGIGLPENTSTPKRNERVDPYGN